MGGGPPGFPQDFTCLAVLWYLLAIVAFSYRTVTVSGLAFQPVRISYCYIYRPATPSVRRPSVWPLPSSLATTKGIEFSFFSSGYLDVSLPRVPPVKLWIHLTVSRHYPGRVSPFGYLRIKAYLRLPEAFRSLSRPSSAISALASTLRSCSLDLCLPLCSLLRLFSGTSGTYFVLLLRLYHVVS